MFPVGATPILHILATSCEFLPSPMGADSVPWVLPCPKAMGALTRALAAECLESLKKVRIPPSNTVQEEFQFFLGKGAGVTQG